MLNTMRYSLRKKYLLLIVLLTLSAISSYRGALSSESDHIKWQVGLLDVIIYDLDVERKEVNLQWYLSFDANSSLETRVIYLPKTQHTYVYHGESADGIWYHYIIDRRRINLEASSNQFLYPFDCYIIKILVSFNATLETENLHEELSKANFRIEKDIDRNIEAYWDISNATMVLDEIPEEYAEFLDSTNKTVFQIQITLTRKIHQWIVPFFSFWIFPIAASAVLSFFLFLFVKKEKGFKILSSWGFGIIGLSGLFLTLLFRIQSLKPPSCITVAEGVIIGAWVWTIILLLLASISVMQAQRSVKLTDDQLKEQALELARSISEFVLDRRKIEPKIDFNDWSGSTERVTKHSSETINLYYARFASKATLLREEFLVRGIQDKEFEMYYKHPTNDIGLQILALRLAALTARV